MLPSGVVVVDAPENVDISRVKKVVAKKADWILKQQKDFLEFSPMPPKRYVSGETFRFLGNPYRLNIVLSKNKKIERTKERINLFIDGSEINIKAFLDSWFRTQAEEVFVERLLFCMDKVKKIGVESTPTIKLRKMQKRWGSCTRDGLIILNPELVKAPIDCIDYVLVHELCHLKEHSHNKRFYQLLDTALPSWRSEKRKLNRYGSD